MEVVNWLDSHSGTITATATVVLAVITWRYVCLTGRLIKAADRPKIAIYLRPDEANKNCAMLSVENIGTGPAHDIQFKTDLSFRTYGQYSLGDVGFLKRGITYLPPRRTYDCFLRLEDRLSELQETPLEISVTYRDSRNKTKKDCFCLDFGELPSLVSDTPPFYEMTRTLKEIANLLRSFINTETETQFPGWMNKTTEEIDIKM